MNKISLFWPHMPKEEVMSALSETLDTRWLGEGPKVKEFEKVYSEYIEYPYCIAVNSGTSALNLAYDLIGLKAGDEVLTPVLTCTATQHGLLKIGCKLRFIDVDPLTLLPSMDDILSKANKNTKAIVVTHLGGKVFDVEGLKRFNLPIVEDCCQALGAKYDDGTMVGSSGNYCIFSFQAIKHITTGDGGMLCLPNKTKYMEAKRKRWFGIDRDKKIEEKWQPVRNRQITFDVDEIGFKYQMNDITATIGIVQMKYLDGIVKQRKLLVGLYRSLLRDIEGITLFEYNGGDSCWLFGVYADNRNYLQKWLEKKGIETNIVQVRNDIYKIFGGERQRLKNMDEIEDNYLYLPLHSNLTREDVERVCQEIKVFYAD